MPNDPDDLRRYLNNEMTTPERHAFEKKALADPFLAEAIEGAETLSPEQFGKDVNKLSERIARPARRGFLTLRIAAGFAALLALGWLIYRSVPPSPQPLAQNGADSTLAEKDTTRPMLTLAPSKTAESPPQEQPRVTSAPAADKEKTTEPVQPSAVTPEPATTKVAETAAVAEDAAKAEEEIRETAPKTAASGASTPKSIQLDVAEKRALSKNDRTKTSEVITPILPVADDTDFSPAAPEGGAEAYRRYLEENREMPKEAQQAGVHGLVTIDFTVSAGGEPGDYVVFKSMGHGCDQELIRLIQTGPRWTPAKRKGKPEVSTVRVSLMF